MSDLLLRRREGNVEILTLNRADKHNCVNTEMAAAMRNAFDDLETLCDVGAVILTGRGDSFSSGVDLLQLAEEGPEMIPSVIFPDTGWCGIGQRDFSKPLIAAVNGLALAGGLELALSCDFVIASENAEFGVNEVTLGPIADAGACFRLPRWVPLPFAKEMLFTGRRIGAEEANRVGLCNRVVAPDSLIDTTLEIARKIAGNSQSSMRITKSLISKTLGLPENQAWVINDEHMLESFGTDDFMEGPRAFSEKRDTKFT